MHDQNQLPQTYHYEIRVKGKLDSIWSDWFDGFMISPTNGDTILVGAVTDQAALHGMLSKIRDLGLPIVSIKSEG